MPSVFLAAVSSAMEEVLEDRPPRGSAPTSEAIALPRGTVVRSHRGEDGMADTHVGESPSPRRCIRKRDGASPCRIMLPRLFSCAGRAGSRMASATAQLVHPPDRLLKG